ncbi:MAG: LysM domain-containing protein [Prevotellaceae bacterium]|jgi:LysM repeat protein|nr:LysM domain-containing protein [Prevotellaceae bacterium]
MQTTVQNRQTLLDIAVQEMGSAEAVFELAAANNLSITDALENGQILQIPQSANNYVQRQVVKYYNVNKINPATAIENATPEGIEFWAIEYDFVING